MRPDHATWRTLLSQSRYLGRPDVAELVSASEHLQHTIEMETFELGYCTCRDVTGMMVLPASSQCLPGAVACFQSARCSVMLCWKGAAL